MIEYPHTHPPSPTLHDPAVRLLHDLVATPSLSGDEGRAAALLADRMNALGFDARVDEVGNAVGVIARPDAQGRTADILLVGHIDTVPGHIDVRIEDGVLHGRGAVEIGRAHV